MSIKKNLKVITGVSILNIGVSWDLSKTEREVIRKLLTFLEMKRVLYNPYDLEEVRHVIDSIIDIRDNLTKALQDIDESSNLNHYLRPMRTSCNKFLDSTSTNKYGSMLDRNGTFTSLGEVRAMFGFYLKILSEMFNIKVEKKLATIFPLDD